MAQLNKSDDGLIEASSIKVSINFTEPSIISLMAKDSIYVELKREIFAEESILYSSPEAF